MNNSLINYFFGGALMLTIISGAVILGNMLVWRRRCKQLQSKYDSNELRMKGEIDELRARLDDVLRENHDVGEELTAIRREIADRDVALESQLQSPPEKKIDILALLAQTDGTTSEPSTIYSRFLEVVKNQLGNSSLQIDDIGQQLNLSRVQLYRRLKAETGMTPNELLRSYRLAEAARMLTTTDLTVAEIAYRVGFSSPSYFSRCFREQFDTLPQDLRSTSRR